MNIMTITLHTGVGIGITYNIFSVLLILLSCIGYTSSARLQQLAYQGNLPCQIRF